MCFFYIPPVAFRYPEIKATEVKALKLKVLPPVAFITGYITKLMESKETHCINDIQTETNNSSSTSSCSQRMNDNFVELKPRQV